MEEFIQKKGNWRSELISLWKSEEVAIASMRKGRSGSSMFLRNSRQTVHKSNEKSKNSSIRRINGKLKGVHNN